MAKIVYLFFLASFCFGFSDAEYHLRFESRYGYHLRSPFDLATHRQTLNAEGKTKFGSNISITAGFRGKVEGGLAANETRYGNSATVHQDSSEVWVRNLYLQFKQSSFDIRLGNQQAVWGEAFGYYFADIINPKDLRELGLGDLEENRLPTPMLNVRWIGEKSSVQFIYIPKPYFHRLPSVGSDFFVLGNSFPTTPLIVDDARTVPWDISNGETGLKLSSEWSGLDISILGFYYFDRFPHFTSQLTSQGLLLNSQHERIFTSGLTATYDLSGVLIRMETLFTKNRYLDSLSIGTLQTNKSDEATGVIELDYTGMDSWQLGFQFAYTRLLEDITPLLGYRDTILMSLQANGKIWRDHGLDLLMTYVPKDGSLLIHGSYLFPLSDKMELQASADFFQGGGASLFGQYQSATRTFLTLKAYLGS